VAGAEGLPSDPACCARTAGVDLPGAGCPTLARPKRDAGALPVPLVAARTAAHPDTRRGHIHPPLDLARDEIDLHAIPSIPGMVA
jgi:hypothetical protein